MTVTPGNGISRRGVIGTAAAVAAVGWSAGSGTGWAAPRAAGGAEGLHERMVRAAAPRWRRMPGDWKDGPFLGNGLLGVQVYRGATANSVKVMVSHSQVQDQRPQWRAPYGFSRLPIGHFDLTLAGEVTGVDWTLDLWDAELRGTVTTTRGSVRFSMLVHNTRAALLISTRPSAGEEDAAWSFTWMSATSPRTKDKPADYTGNPDPSVGSAGDTGATRYVEQPLIAGGGWTTAWRERRVGSGRLLAAHIVYRFPEDLSRTTELAVAEVARTLSFDPDDLVREHRDWWHRFYRRSLLSVPDKRIQDFYWIQLYKAACATRAGGPSMSEWGPWYPETGGSWTAVWWNLNVQIATWLIQGSNHLELDSVTSTFKDFEEFLPLSVPPEYQDGQTYALAHPSDWKLRPGAKTVGIPGTSTKTDNNGNLIWAMHNVWLSYRHTMDVSIVRDVLFPILVKAANFYDHFLYEGSDGRLHLPLTRSPEWADAEDCTYDLSLLRWGCATLLDCLRILRTDHPRAARWREILRRMVDYPRDPTGIMIGAGKPLTESHRHFSHMLWLYPLHELNWDRPADREIMRTTFDHWIKDRGLWAGYSYAVASSMASVIERPEEALDFLTFFTDGNVVHQTWGARMTPNTMYVEDTNLGIESPLTAAQSVLDTAVQSHGGIVRVFPSVSRRWPDFSVQALRTQGAFLIDADRSGGRTRWVRVHSEAGAPLVLQHGIDGAIDVRDEHGRRLRYRETGAGRIEVPLGRGETAVVLRRGTDADLGPRDVPAVGDSKPWGLPD
ncbi:glycosyl hydrolase family 95 catalytic domain-containing protein [Streptomyces sp. KM273126]|uniref:glycosyl hydrolase family 95 catalytic domain-containing protein n=1 Tax=Streptomyces sp. KM273126 TaxID=2545247 RepID=UPI00268E04BE